MRDVHRYMYTRMSHVLWITIISLLRRMERFLTFRSSFPSQLVFWFCKNQHFASSSLLNMIFNIIFFRLFLNAFFSFTLLVSFLSQSFESNVNLEKKIVYNLKFCIFCSLFSSQKEYMNGWMCVCCCSKLISVINRFIFKI